MLAAPATDRSAQTETVRRSEVALFLTMLLRFD